MKRTIVIVISLLMCFAAFCLSDEDILFLKNLDSFSGTSLAGSYSQVKSVVGSTRSLTTTGKVLISPEDGIAWLAEKPYSSKLIVTKDHLTQQIRDGKPSLLDVSGNEIYTQIATALECVFFGDFDTMLKAFEADFSRTDASWLLTLVPREKTLSAFIKSIEITGSNSINELCLYQTTGDKVVYGFVDLIVRELTSEEKAVYSL